jgi:hypothetical protein
VAARARGNADAVQNADDALTTTTKKKMVTGKETRTEASSHRE